MIVEQRAVLIFSLLGMDAALNPAFALATGLASMGNEVVFLHLVDGDADGEILELTPGLSTLRFSLSAPSGWRMPWMRRQRNGRLDALNLQSDIVFTFDCSIDRRMAKAHTIGYWSGSAQPKRWPSAMLDHYDLCLTTDTGVYSALAKRHPQVVRTAPFFLPRTCEPWLEQRLRLPRAMVLVDAEATAHPTLDALGQLGILQLSVFEQSAMPDEHTLYRLFGECDLIIDLRSGSDTSWLQLHALNSGRYCMFLQNTLDAPVTSVANRTQLPEILQNALPRLEALNRIDEQQFRRAFAARHSVEEWIDRLPVL